MKTLSFKIAVFMSLVAFLAANPALAAANRKKGIIPSAQAKTSKSVAPVETKKPAAPVAAKTKKSAVPATTAGIPVPVVPTAKTVAPDVKGLDAQMVEALAPAPQNADVEELPAPTAEPQMPAPESVTPTAFPQKSGYIGTQETQKTPVPTSANQNLTDKLISLNGAPGQATPVDPLERMALPTLGIVALIAVFALLWKFMISRGSGLFAAQDKLRILGQQMIGPRSKVIIIEALGKKYLIGATPERVSLIADLDFFAPADEDASPAFAPRAEARRSESASSVSGGTPDFDLDAEETADKIKERLKSLKKMSK